MEKRYLSSYEYNCASILEHLRGIVENKGGYLVTTWKKTQHYFHVVNRSRADAIRELSSFLSRCTRTEKNAEYYDKKSKELEAYEKAESPDFRTIFGDYRYIQFFLDGMLYYYSMDNNPFFGVSWSKRPVSSNGTVARNYYSEHEDSPHWLSDRHLSMMCTDAEREAAAIKIFNQLKKANPSTRYGQSTVSETLYKLIAE